MVYRSAKSGFQHFVMISAYCCGQPSGICMGASRRQETHGGLQKHGNTRDIIIAHD